MSQDPNLWLWEGKTPAEIWGSRVSTPPPPSPPQPLHSRTPYLVMLALLLIVLSLLILVPASDSAVEMIEPLPSSSAQAALPLEVISPPSLEVISPPLPLSPPTVKKLAHPRPTVRQSPFAIHGTLTPPKP